MFKQKNQNRGNDKGNNKSDTIGRGNNSPYIWPDPPSYNDTQLAQVALDAANTVAMINMMNS